MSRARGVMLRSRLWRLLLCLTVAAPLAAEYMQPDIENVPVDRPVALLFGSETAGVSDEARALADGVITVPMDGLTESLNVSTAAACLISRVAQRRRAAFGPDLEQERQDAFYADWVDRESEARAGAQARTEE